MEDLASLLTEARNPRSEHIDQLSQAIEEQLGPFAPGVPLAATITGVTPMRKTHSAPVQCGGRGTATALKGPGSWSFSFGSFK